MQCFLKTYLISQTEPNSFHKTPGNTVCKISAIGMPFKIFRKAHFTNYPIIAEHSYYSCFKSYVVLTSSYMNMYNSNFHTFDIKWRVKYKFENQVLSRYYPSWLAYLNNNSFLLKTVVTIICFTNSISKCLHNYILLVWITMILRQNGPRYLYSNLKQIILMHRAKISLNTSILINHIPSAFFLFQRDVLINN